MTDREPLLATILDRPDDDGPRLVCADWLEEQGESERAELIRVGCQLSTWDCNFKQTKEQPGWKHECGTDEKGFWLCHPLRSRERELLKRHAQKWFPLDRAAVFSVWDDNNTATIRYETGQLNRGTNHGVRRGFVESVTCAAPDWLQHADAILAAHPVQAVTLTTWMEIEIDPPRIAERRREKDKKTVLRGEFDATIAGRRPQRYACESTLSDGAACLGRQDEIAHFRRRFQAQLADAMTPAGVLRMTWPRVKTWTLPPARTTYYEGRNATISWNPQGRPADSFDLQFSAADLGVPANLLQGDSNYSSRVAEIYRITINGRHVVYGQTPEEAMRAAEAYRDTLPLGEFWSQSAVERVARQ